MQLFELYLLGGTGGHRDATVLGKLNLVELFCRRHLTHLCVYRQYGKHLSLDLAMILALSRVPASVSIAKNLEASSYEHLRTAHSHTTVSNHLPNPSLKDPTEEILFSAPATALRKY